MEIIMWLMMLLLLPKLLPIAESNFLSNVSTVTGVLGSLRSHHPVKRHVSSLTGPTCCLTELEEAVTAILNQV